MKQKNFILMVVFSAALIFSLGCQEEKQNGSGKHRTIVAQNRQLKKDFDDCEKQTSKLRKTIDKLQQKNDALNNQTNRLNAGTDKSPLTGPMLQLMDITFKESQRLKEENEMLKKRIVDLEK